MVFVNFGFKKGQRKTVYRRIKKIFQIKIVQYQKTVQKNSFVNFLSVNQRRPQAFCQIKKMYQIYIDQYKKIVLRFLYKFLASEPGQVPVRTQKQFFFELKIEKYSRGEIQYEKKAFCKYIIIKPGKAQRRAKKQFLFKLKNALHEICSVRKIILQMFHHREIPRWRAKKCLLKLTNVSNNCKKVIACQRRAVGAVDKGNITHR